MGDVDFRSVSKRFDGQTVVAELDLHINDGEFMVLVGPSGCGKSTALRMLAGLEDVSDGTISIAGRVVNDVAPRDRDIAMVFQNYALYPHMTVRENLGFALRLRGSTRAEIDRGVTGAAELLGITHLLERRPRELSGGQRQRVAVGRAIVRNPAVFLFDEPLSNLDAKLRGEMRAEIIKLQQRLGTTTVYVTHDQVEAMTMGHRIAVMRNGRIQQLGTPLEVYERPANLFVAGFIGTPPMNLLLAKTLGLSPPDAIAGIRPEHIVPGDDFRLPIEVVEPLGHAVIVHVRLEDKPLIAALPPGRIPRVGDTIGLKIQREQVHLFDATTEQRL
jgi:multiple sugar transport system ATP-binding protein